MTLPRVVLQPRRARPFYGRHPWVFAGAVSAVAGNPADGDVVDVVSHTGNFIARGLYNSKSKIRVRLYSWSPEETLEADFFRSKLEAAIRLRGPILGLDGPGRACRLVFSEGDGLSGLTVDRYDRWLVVQFTSLALGQRREMIADLLMELAHPEGIYLRTERGIGKLEGLELSDGLLRGTLPAEAIVIEEPITLPPLRRGGGGGSSADPPPPAPPSKGGEDVVRFRINLAEGQKTGFYLDQRDNRQAVARLASGRRMLDAFCYTGGFGLHAAKAGAMEVIGVDVSEPALELARSNAELNGLAGLTFVRADVFSFLDAQVEQGEKFGMVVLDPPKFARARHAIEDALRGYRQLQTQAIKLLEPDGILVTCCCSGLITREMLEGLLAQLAAESGRPIQLLEVRGQAPDHPVAATCLESNYLKCLIARVGA